MELKVNDIDEAKLKRASAAMDELRNAMEALHECKVQMVSVILPEVEGNNGRVMIMTNLHPEQAAPMLWQGLGQTQAIIKATQPPTMTKQ